MRCNRRGGAALLAVIQPSDLVAEKCVAGCYVREPLPLRGIVSTVYTEILKLSF